MRDPPQQCRERQRFFDDYCSEEGYLGSILLLASTRLYGIFYKSTLSLSFSAQCGCFLKKSWVKKKGTFLQMKISP